MRGHPEWHPTSNVVSVFEAGIELPAPDNTPEGLKILRAANERFRQIPWPSPFDRTTHALWSGDARDLSHVADESVHLVVTSPPYWILEDYPPAPGQLGTIEDYEAFLDELDEAWRECARVLAPGGRLCCVVGDVCVPRRRLGRHLVMPLHADVQARARGLGLDVLTRSASECFAVSIGQTHREPGFANVADGSPMRSSGHADRQAFEGGQADNPVAGRTAGKVSHHPASLGYHASGYHGPRGEHSEMEYRLGIPTRGPRAGRASIEAIATRAKAPGFCCLATSDRFAAPRAIASRHPCTDTGAFPDSARFLSMPISTSDEDGIRLPGRAPHGGSHG